MYYLKLEIDSQKTDIQELQEEINHLSWLSVSQAMNIFYIETILFLIQLKSNHFVTNTY